jgi:hypothetical protein
MDIGELSAEIKRPVDESDHSTPSGAEVKNECSYTSVVPIHHNDVKRTSLSLIG